VVELSPGSHVPVTRPHQLAGRPKRVQVHSATEVIVTRAWMWGVLLIAGCGLLPGGGGGGDDDDDDDDGIGLGGSQERRACNNAADCADTAGADAVDVDSCVEDAETAQEEANAAGCGQQYDDYTACAATADCDADTGFLLGCDSEATAYIECIIGY